MSPITESQIDSVYILQSRNVRHLSKVKANLVRDLNKNLKRNNIFEVEAKTKLFSLLYSAWSEAQFVQILHTPKGFYPREIQDVKNKRDRNGIIPGWVLMVELAIQKVGNFNSSSDLNQKQEKLITIIKNNIENQSIIRNKIAHGQWLHALNSSQTAESPFTSELRALDYVRLDCLFEIHKYLGSIIRDLVQSPQKGFHNNYWTNLANLEQYIEGSKDWTLETRKTMLAKRPTKYKS